MRTSMMVHPLSFQSIFADQLGLHNFGSFDFFRTWCYCGPHRNQNLSLVLGSLSFGDPRRLKTKNVNVGSVQSNAAGRTCKLILITKINYPSFALYFWQIISCHLAIPSKRLWELINVYYNYILGRPNVNVLRLSKEIYLYSRWKQGNWFDINSIAQHPYLLF